MPAGVVRAGDAFSFALKTRDGDGDAFSFSASNLPRWCSINSTTGEISGTPTVLDVGVYSDIMLKVADGTASASLMPFTIGVFA